jgi:hypothetical protein
VIPFNWCLSRYLPGFFPLKNKFMKNYGFRKRLILLTAIPRRCHSG